MTIKKTKIVVKRFIEIFFFDFVKFITFVSKKSLIRIDKFKHQTTIQFANDEIVRR